MSCGSVGHKVPKHIQYGALHFSSFIGKLDRFSECHAMDNFVLGRWVVNCSEARAFLAI